MSKVPSGIGFVGCEFLRSASADGAQAGGATPHDHGHRREVVINGTRVRTVDVHAHCAVPEALAVLGKDCEKAGLLMEDTSARLAAMDERGLDVSALSINPYWYHVERDAAAELIRIQNDALAEFYAATPDRFVAFATIALQHPDLAVEQISYAVKTLGLRGVSVGCGVEGQELADERFHPVWAKCEEMDLLVFMHPSGTKELEPSGRLAGSGVLTNTIGNPLETTIALSHLIFEGTMDRYPGLKICAVHGDTDQIAHAYQYKGVADGSDNSFTAAAETPVVTESAQNVSSPDSVSIESPQNPKVVNDGISEESGTPAGAVEDGFRNGPSVSDRSEPRNETWRLGESRNSLPEPGEDGPASPRIDPTAIATEFAQAHQFSDCVQIVLGSARDNISCHDIIHRQVEHFGPVLVDRRHNVSFRDDAYKAIAVHHHGNRSEFFERIRPAASAMEVWDLTE